VREAVDLAQEQDLALALGQRGDVRERGAQLLAAADDRVRVGLALGGGGARVELVARDGLRAGGAGTAQLVQRAVAHQAVEPRAHREGAIVLAHRAVGLGEDLLDDVLGPGRAVAHDAGPA
jgi:hypothetical protein